MKFVLGKGVKMEIEAELRSPVATVQLIHYLFTEPPLDRLLRDEEGMYRVELCLTSCHRSARACYPGHWSRNRYERMGGLFLVTPSTSLLVKSDEVAPLTSIVCQLNPELLRAYCDGILEWTDQNLAATLDIRDTTSRSLLLRLAEEAKHPGFASEILTELVSGQLAIELARYNKAVTEYPGKGGLAPWQLRRIEERLQEVRKAPTLAELAELCRLSVRQMSRGFHKSRGCSIGDYVTKRQIEHAKQLLATDESITSIGHSLGFSSSSNFCFAFRRAMELTPRQYRQRLHRAH